MTRTPFARNGWVTTLLPDGVTVHCHLKATGGDSVVISDIMISADDVNTDVLRSVQPGRVIASAFQSWAEQFPAAPGEGFTEDRFLHLEAWLSSSDDDVTMGEVRSWPATPIEPSPRQPLGRPAPGKESTFYKRVAVAYRSAATESSKPAVVLANEAGVPVETARRWIKEARRRGYLPPGQRGRTQ